MVRVVGKIAAEWKMVADYLNYDIPTINLIAETGKEDPQLRSIMQA